MCEIRSRGLEHLEDYIAFTSSWKGGVGRAGRMGVTEEVSLFAPSQHPNTCKDDPKGVAKGPPPELLGLDWNN